MFAVVEINGKQYKVTSKAIIQVEKIEVEPGETLTFDKVLLSSEENGDNAKIGMPYLQAGSVTAKVMEHIKGEKIRIFKFIPKKRHQKTQGHRQPYTLLEIQDIAV